MKGFNEGKIVIHTDCRKAWKLLTSEKLKESQLEGDCRSIISRVVELKSKSKIEFEQARVKTTSIEDNKITNKGLEMVLKCERKKKELGAQEKIELKMHQ